MTLPNTVKPNLFQCSDNDSVVGLCWVGEGSYFERGDALYRFLSLHTRLLSVPSNGFLFICTLAHPPYIPSLFLFPSSFHHFAYCHHKPEGHRMTQCFEWVLIAAECGVTDSELSN